MSYECTHMLLGSIEHTPNRMSPLRDEPGREMREHMLEVHVFCFSNTQVWGEHRLNGRQQKWGEKNERHRRLLSWQMMFHLRGFTVLQLPLRFISLLFLAEWPRGLSISWNESQKAGNVSLFCLWCWQMQHEISGTHWKFNAGKFMVQSVLEMNQAYSIYPKPNLSMSKPKKENKMYIFSDRQ